MPHPSSTFLQLDFRGASHLGLLEILFAFLFVDLFDNVGTLVGVCEQGGFIKNGKIPRVGRVLVADAVGTIVGALTGTSTVTSYIESAAGVAAGARTGLSNIAVATLFLLSDFLLAAGYRDSGICDGACANSGRRPDDAIDLADRVAGLQRGCSGVCHDARHASDVQHCDWTQLGIDFLHDCESCIGKVARDKSAGLDPYDSVHPAICVSRRGLAARMWPPFSASKFRKNRNLQMIDDSLRAPMNDCVRITCRTPIETQPLVSRKN